MLEKQLVILEEIKPLQWWKIIFIDQVWKKMWLRMSPDIEPANYQREKGRIQVYTCHFCATWAMARPMHGFCPWFAENCQRHDCIRVVVNHYSKMVQFIPCLRTKDVAWLLNSSSRNTYQKNKKKNSSSRKLFTFMIFLNWMVGPWVTSGELYGKYWMPN